MSEEPSLEARAYHALRMRTELRRGGLSLAVLAALRTEDYASSLRRRLADAGLDIEEGTLYPMVRRLESQGLLCSEWRERDGRKRRYYVASDDGLWVLDQLLGEWNQMVISLQQLGGRDG